MTEPIIEIELDRRRPLRLTARDLFLFEKRCGLGLGVLLGADRNVGQTLALLELALRHDDPTIDEERVLELVDLAPRPTALERYQYVEDRVGRVLASCFPSSMRRAAEQVLDRQLASMTEAADGTGKSTSD